MDFGPPNQGTPSFYDPAVAAEMSALASAITPKTADLDWDAGSCVDVSNAAPAAAAASPFVAFPVQTMGYPQFTGLGAAATAAAAIGGVEAPLPMQTGINGNDSLLVMAQKTTRAARNGREQQRAQKISDVIDKLKGMLDKANFTSGDSTSKLHVLTSCEGYIRSLQDRSRCYEMEAKLRSASRRNNSPLDVNDSPARCGGNGDGSSSASATADNNDIDWAKKVQETQSDESSSAETVNRDKAGGGAVRGGESSDTKGAFYDEENSAESSSSSGSSSGMEIAGPFARPLSSSATESGAGSSVDDGDMGSTDDCGADTSVGTTDSGSQGFTTDTASRGFATDSGYTDSSFGGDSGSADSSGDAGSGDAGSDGSEEGTSDPWVRVVNYFDIFRFSSVPMAIASTDGALVDVNDAMRGFGRIGQDTVKTLTVKSLVAPESSQALEAAMGNMLTPGLQVAAGGPQGGGGSQPFLANAGIGDRPTLLTVSLVYDDRGEAKAFHVALIPRSRNPSGGQVGARRSSDTSSTNYACDAPCLSVKDVESRAGCGTGTLGKRSVRFSDAGGQKKPQKRQAIAAPSL